MKSDIPKAKFKAILETNYFPSIEYIKKLWDYEVIYIEAWENYQKHSFRNRCQICSAQGITTLTVPLEKGKNNNCPIKDVKIAYHADWQINHIKTLRTAYGKSPYFEHYEEWLNPLLSRKEPFLYDLNMLILESIIELFALPTVLKETDTYFKKPLLEYVDLRNKHDRKNLSKSSPKPYEQVFSDRLAFVPNLSILDLIFCKGPETTHWLKSTSS